MTVRPAHSGDIPAVAALLARSYPRLLKADYLPSVLVTALPLISRAKPELITCGTYYVVEQDGQIRAAGGWTAHSPQGGPQQVDIAHIRHVVSDPDSLHQGHARAILHHIFVEARAAGRTKLDCLSTLTAVPFYMRLGFQRIAPQTLTLRPGITFDVVAMQRPI